MMAEHDGITSQCGESHVCHNWVNIVTRTQGDNLNVANIWDNAGTTPFEILSGDG